LKNFFMILILAIAITSVFQLIVVGETTDNDRKSIGPDISAEYVKQDQPKQDESNYEDKEKGNELKKEEIKQEEKNQDKTIIETEKQKNDKSIEEIDKTKKENIDSIEPEKEKAEKQKSETKKPKDKKIPIFDPNSTEYIGLIFGYGGFFPVADYGARYKAAHNLAVAVPVYYLTLWRFYPELHFRYAEMENKQAPFRYDSTITLMEFFPAIAFRWDFGLPAHYMGPVQIYARLYDGVARTDYRSLNPYFPYLGKKDIVEFINVFGVAVGCNYFIFKGLFVGLEFGYSTIATAGKPLQAVLLLINIGYRIL